MVLKKLSMNEVTKRTGTAKLRTMLKATLTLERPVLICSVILPTLLDIWLAGFFKTGRLLVCKAPDYSVSEKYSRIESTPATLPKSELTV